jgi:hypothetical protein
MGEGDILSHEPMGVVEAVGSDVGDGCSGSKLYGEVPGGQAECLRVPQAQFNRDVTGGRGPGLRHRRCRDGSARLPLREIPATSHCSTSRFNREWAKANVKRRVPDIMPLLTDDDPLGVETFGGICDVPSEGRRHDQGRPEAVTRERAAVVRPAAR